jgi:O-antigen/teichoic acid export membrane protein
MSSRYARNSLYASVTGLCTTLANFFGTVIIARLLGVEATGIVAYAIWLTMTIVVIADLGITITLARYLPELRARGEEQEASRLAAFLIVPFALSILIAPAVLVPLSALLLGGPALGGAGAIARSICWLTGLCCIVQAFGAFGLGYLQATQQFRWAAGLAVISLAVLLAAMTAGCLAFGTEGALGGYIASNAVPAVACLGIVKRDRAVLPALKTRVMRYARYNWATAIVVTFVYSRVELFFLQQFRGSQAVAMFSVGLTLSSLATQGPLLLTRGAFYYFAEQLGKPDEAPLRQAFTTGTRLIGFLVFPACLGSVAIMPRLLPMIYGASFADAVPATSILVCSAGVVAAGTMISNLLLANERNSFILWNGVIGAVVASIFGITLVPAFGTLGAACGRAIIQFALSCSGAWYVSKVLRIQIPFGGLARLLAAAMLSAAAARLCIIGLTGPEAMPVAILAGAATYGLGVRLLRALPVSDADRLQGWMRSLPLVLRVTMAVLLRVICKHPARSQHVITP